MLWTVLGEECNDDTIMLCAPGNIFLYIYCSASDIRKNLNKWIPPHSPQNFQLFSSILLYQHATTTKPKTPNYTILP